MAAKSVLVILGSHIHTHIHIHLIRLTLYIADRDGPRWPVGESRLGESRTLADFSTIQLLVRTLRGASHDN